MERQRVRAVVVQPCAACSNAVRAGVSVALDARMVLYFSLLVGLKYQRVRLAPGLVGVVLSDDGRAVTLRYQEARAWLAAPSR